MSDVTFRACVGAAILDPRGYVLACERSKRSGSWQLPQGGLLPGEAPLDAALREVEEETGIPAERLHLLDEHPDWLAYELPEERRGDKHGRGQVQRWFLFRLDGDESAIDLGRASSDEFSKWRWQRLNELAEQVVPFKRTVYRKLVTRFRPHLAAH